MAATVTALISRAVRPGRLASFRDWADRIDASAAAQPGHLGSLRLEQSGGLHHLVYRFDAAPALAVWQDAHSYRALMQAGDHASVGLVQTKEGANVRFEMPSETGGKKWKNFVVTWLTVVPVLLLVSTGARALLPGVPPVLQTMASSVLLTGILTWIILPRVQRWSRFWLLQDSAGHLRKGADQG